MVVTPIVPADLTLEATRFEKVKEGESFEVPDEVLERPRYIFGFHVAILYRSMAEIEKLAEFFDVSKQSIWIWRRNCVPHSRREKLHEAIFSDDQRIRLASNVTVDDLLRTYRSTSSKRDTKPNYKWLDLLYKIESGAFKGLDRSFIPTLSNPENSTRSLAYYWGWDTGGVPASPRERVWSILIEAGIHKEFDMDEMQFKDYCDLNFKA